MKKICLLFILPLLCFGQSFGQCTPVDCSASLPAYGGVCDTVLIQAVVGTPYSDFESFVITDNCFDAGLISPDNAGTNIRISNVDNFTFGALPAGLTGTSNASSYSPPSGGIVVGCASVSGTPTEAGVFEFSIDFLADVILCSFPVPINDNAANYLVDLTVLPDASFSGLNASYCPTDSDVTLMMTGTTGGTFSGPGVSGNNFSPAFAGIGVHTITYTVSAQQGAAVAAATASSSMTVTVGNPVFVDASASGMNDGSTWANAFTDLQDALAVAGNSCGKDILIAEGTYKPGNERGIFFTVDNSANLRGGYPMGGGTTADPVANPTILSGDIDNDGTLAGNSFHVVRASGGATVNLYDLTITGGNSDGNIAQFGRSRGGGIFVNDAIFSINNCNITGNFAVLGGGLFATLSNSTTISGCRIDLNEAERGSALYHSNETNMYIRKSRILNNNSTNRCAIEINNSLYTSIENTVVANNASGNANAIGLIATNRDQTCEIINSTILGESKNRSLFSMQVGFGDELNVNVFNSIIAHQNMAFDKNIVVFNNNILNFTVSNSYFAGSALTNLQGGGTNNITETATLYADTAGDLNLNPNYSTNVCSPVVNTGDNTYSLLLSSATDINGSPRVAQIIVDMGAYEKEGICQVRESGEPFTTELENNFTIYPNPVNDIVNIQTDMEDISVSITDILGRTVIQSFNDNDRTINTRQLPKGMYIINIYQNGELKGSEKLMKN